MELAGRTIGNYQITEELGRGGMAVVYRAYQPSLNRYVAIKVLPPQFSFDRQFIERFQREARAAAGLRHPNIVVIHDVGHQEGVYYLVMEYLEGRTLKDVIEQEGPLPARRVGRIVEQVATALDYAHQRGFVHRDVKPANIFVGKDDHVTLTDFGIAKAASETQHLTRTGTLMGTPEYMSPEQAEGGTVDHRTDLYALGVVLYQMLVGRVPFRGTTPHAVLHAVIYEPPPPPRQINPNLNPALEAVIVKAVAKRPGQRFQRGAELTAALRGALRGKAPRVTVPPPRGVPPPQAATPRRGSRPAAEAVAARGGDSRRSPVLWIIAAIAGIVVLILGGLLLFGGGGDGPPVPSTTPAVLLTHFVVVTDTPIATTPESKPSQTVPPTPPLTGEAVATDMPIPATDTPSPPTTTPLPPTATSPPPSPTPSAYFGRLAFSSTRDGNPEIYVLNLAGGSPRRLTNNNSNDWLPDWSPDGAGGTPRLVFTSNRTGSYDLWVMNADGSGQIPIVTTGAWDEYGRWAPDGQRLSFSSTATTQGVPNSEVFVRLADGTLVQRTSSTAEDQWTDWSPDGRLIYTEGFKGDSNWDIYIVNADGSNRTLWLGGGTCDVQPAWSPDGQWIAFIRIPRDTNGNGGIDFEDAGDVWVGKVSGGGLQQVTSGVWATTPAWSPDSQWIAFARVRDSNANGRSDGQDAVDIWAAPFQGGDAVPLVQSPHRDGDPTWTW
jgi:serine/threonine protein kinase